jgi:hypothetical protein
MGWASIRDHHADRLADYAHQHPGRPDHARVPDAARFLNPAPPTLYEAPAFTLDPSERAAVSATLGMALDDSPESQVELGQAFDLLDFRHALYPDEVLRLLRGLVISNRLGYGSCDLRLLAQRAEQYLERPLVQRLLRAT